MSNEIHFDGVRYVSAAEAGRSTDLTRDYIARLCREGKLRGRRVGKNWYIDYPSLLSFLVTQKYERSAMQMELAQVRAREYQLSSNPKHSFQDFQAKRQGKPLSGSQNDITVQMARAVATHAVHTPPGISDIALRVAPHASSAIVSPVAEFIHKLVALTLACAVTLGTYSLVYPQYARYAVVTIAKVGTSMRDVYSLIADGVARGQLAAATENTGATLADAVSRVKDFRQAFGVDIERVISLMTFPETSQHGLTKTINGRVMVSVEVPRNPDALCIGSTCITEAQLRALVQNTSPVNGKAK